MGWDYWGAYIFVSGYVTIGFGGYLHALTGIPGVVGSLVLIGACTIVNLLGVRLSGLVQTLIVVLAVAALVGFGALGSLHLHLEYLTPLMPHGLVGVLLAALLAFLAFGGFDMVAAAGEEVRNPERNLPRAILLTLLLVLGLYLLVTFVAISVLPWNLLGQSQAPLSAAALQALGPGGQLLIALAALLTTAATGNAVLVVTSRISFAMARDGLLPRRLAAVSKKTGAPWATVLLNGVCLSLVALSGSIEIAAAIGGFLYVIHFVFPLVALVSLRRRDQVQKSQPAFRTPAPKVVLPLAFAGCALLLVASGWIGVAGGAGWLLLGMLGNRVAASRHRRLPDAEMPL